MSAKLAVLVSGSGTNLQAMIDARAAGRFSPEIALVVSNKPGVKALDRAAQAGIRAEVLDHKAFPDRAAFDAAMDALLRSHGVEYVALAGFMRLLTPTFVRAWHGRLVNLHPSLLPEFPGAHAIRDALAAKAKRTGVTVHFVDEGTDTGPIIAQEAVDIRPDDTEETLAERIHAVEHRLYPRAVDALCRGAIRLEGRRVIGSIA